MFSIIKHPGQIDQRTEPTEGITDSPRDKSSRLNVRFERFFSYLDRTKRKAKREQKDFRRQRDNLSGVSLIGFQVMCPRASLRSCACLILFFLLAR